MQPSREPSEAAETRETREAPPTRGLVQFVGAGPGPADLLTERAVAALHAADVVVHDQLVHPEVLARVPATAKLVPLSRELMELSRDLMELSRELLDLCRESASVGASDAGSAAGRMLADLAAGGRRVVRLKGGDPTVFARLAEELRPIVEAGIAFEIVPGVTAATAAAAAAGVPLTSRSASSSVTLVTGHHAGANADAVDLAPLAAIDGTLAFYMGVDRIEEWTGKLLDAGRPADTPVVIVSRCGWPDQRIAFTTLEKAAEATSRGSMASPAVVVVGSVVGEGSPRTASDARGPVVGRVDRLPLSGVRVLLVRPRGQSEEMSRAFGRLGAECIEAPVIRIGPPDSWAAVDDGIDRAWSYDWIVFSSVNGVRSFVERLRARGFDARALGSARLAAVGPRTAEELAAARLVCDLVPRESFDAESLASSLLDGPSGRRFLVVRADRGRDVLSAKLTAAGHHVTEAIAYTSRDVDAIDPVLRADLSRRPADWIVLSSAAVAAAAVRLFADQLPRMKIASNSGRTSDAARRLGFSPTVESALPTTEAIVEVIVGYERAARRDSGAAAVR